jgi:WD40 repeat protein
MATVNAAKRKFFRSHDPYVKYHPRTNMGRDEDFTSGGVFNSSPSSVCTIYGSTFSSSSSDGNKKYFIACTSNGCITVWDYQDYSRNTLGNNSGPNEPILTLVSLLVFFFFV